MPNRTQANVIAVCPSRFPCSKPVAAAKECGMEVHGAPIMRAATGKRKGTSVRLHVLSRIRLELASARFAAKIVGLAVVLVSNGRRWIHIHPADRVLDALLRRPGSLVTLRLTFMMAHVITSCMIGELGSPPGMPRAPFMPVRRAGIAPPVGPPVLGALSLFSVASDRELTVRMLLAPRALHSSSDHTLPL